MRSISIMTCLCIWVQIGYGQKYHQVDTLKTRQGAEHVYLNIKIPVGEVFMKSSGNCGTSVARLISPEKKLVSDVKVEPVKTGEDKMTFSLKYPGQVAPPEASQAGANLRLPAPQAPNLPHPPKAYRTEYCPDPDLSTDLFLELGRGGSWLDLSGMSFQNVYINSAFADLLVSYNKPNQVPMQKMEIQVANARAVLKHLEMARAQLISIENEAGNTKLILGDRARPGSTIHLKAGVGDCTLIIDKQQPVKLIVKSGIFSEVEIGEEFSDKGSGTFVNQAFHQNARECVKIYCDVDFGNITVMEKQ